MDDVLFKRMCDLYGFAPSRSLREMLDAVVELERLACARLCDELQDWPEGATPDDCAKAIRARRAA